MPHIHFVRFSGDEYNRARRVWGNPDFIHRFWDARAVAEIVPGDVVVFAKGDEHQPINPYTYDDSAHF